MAQPEDKVGTGLEGKEPDKTATDVVAASDYQTLKVQHDAKVAELATLGTELASLRAVSTAAEEAKTQLATMTQKSTQAETKVKELEAQLVMANAAILQTRKQVMKVRFNLGDESLKDLNLSQLEALEKVLPTMKIPTAIGHDANGSGSADGSNLSARELIARGFQQTKP